MRAHPRSRGENRLIHWPTRSLVGSSPLTRGKLGQVRGRQAHQRLIPAHAGKTHGTGGSRPGAGAHPRSRGENHHGTDSRRPRRGSSPLTRGKRVAPPAPTVGPGLIPAHAGKTLKSATFARRVTGSSPLTRGKRDHLTDRNPDEGLIPAHAGKTTPPTRWGRSLPAHPRSRGENSAAFGWINNSLGSSPLTRGKREERSQSGKTWGLIPAHAGKTTPARSLSPATRAHPRSRGENGQDRARHVGCAGSSPLTRGKQIVA